MPVPVKQCVSSRRLSGVKFTIDVTFGSKFNSQHVTRLWAVAIKVNLRYPGVLSLSLQQVFINTHFFTQPGQ